jgi:2-succinyl-5-enolpyruvyl-6-hydroxy-3-cyclohexene-1-carboxylate synthase
MKIKINRNILWSKVLVEQLAKLGVKDACISPGSRNTPLTYAIATSKKMRSSIFVDERSSAFFALGIAKQTKSPVLVVTTSGTAVAELYPAIIEAYKSRTPLIICTADRPSYLRNKGANQTINQKDIYKNHIRYFAELPLPSVSEKAFALLKEEALKAFSICTRGDKGPVHLNLPFEKPFEPDSFTDAVSNKLLNSIWSFSKPAPAKKQSVKKKELAAIKRISKTISGAAKGIILCGSGNYDSSFRKLLILFSQKTGFPIAADGSTGLRFGNSQANHLIENYTSLCSSEKFLKSYDPEIIIQFGAAPTSISMLEFFSKSRAVKYLVNEFGDWCDPSSTAKEIVQCAPSDFCKIVLENIRSRKPSYCWFREMKRLDLAAGKVKGVLLNNQLFPFEGRIVNEVISSLPDKCNLIISNSLPVRDFDSFACALPKEINVYNNRGASGIDGIISTSLGISSRSSLPTYLVIGDLAFYHDLNSLASGIRLSIPLTIILVNNNGGGIFEHLPISRNKEIFNEYFKTPLDLNFESIVTGYGCEHSLINNWTGLRKQIRGSVKNNSIEVIEIQTNSAASLLIRKSYQCEIEKIME